MARVSSLLGSDRGADGEQNKKRHDGVFALVAINIVLFALDKIIGLRQLYLPLDGASWYQYVTSTFCHASLAHISGNLFFLYLFGKLIEEEEGTLGLVVTYLVTGIGANVISEIFLSGGAALGASGAVFGLFVVSVLIKLKWNLRSIVEAAILGQFVVMQVLSEAKDVAKDDGIGHLAHVGGALSGALLVLGVAKFLRKKPAAGSSDASATVSSAATAKTK